MENPEIFKGKFCARRFSPDRIFVPDRGRNQKNHPGFAFYLTFGPKALNFAFGHPGFWAYLTGSAACAILSSLTYKIVIADHV